MIVMGPFQLGIFYDSMIVVAQYHCNPTMPNYCKPAVLSQPNTYNFLQQKMIFLLQYYCNLVIHCNAEILPAGCMSLATSKSN